MNIVLDENVSLGLADKLRNQGYNVISIAENPDRGFTDDEILYYARKLNPCLLREIITLLILFVFLPKAQKALYTSAMATSDLKRKLNS